MHQTFTLTRAAALDHLARAAPRTGRAYASHRNTDAGPQAQPTTTALSPYLRRRLLLESEAVDAALAAHSAQAAEKFVEEVFWRTYFKGHLETHPTAWTRYTEAARAQHVRLAENAGHRTAYEAATEGRTGIDCFDAWARELVADGWLHNHTRMWFASIWIFTLRLPWELGADFFMRHLLDGDPASNTLSWRWVGGLHTRGKAYAARAENIHRYTDGRFSPDGLDEHPEPLQEAEPPRAVPIRAADTPPDDDAALLLHLDDLLPESLPLGRSRVVRLSGMLAHAPHASDMVRKADAQAMEDALARASELFGCKPVAYGPGWADGLPVIAACAPVGPSADALPPGCLQLRRSWDDLAWPHGTRGYFQMRAAIPKILRSV